MVIIPDNDQVGRAHSETVRKSLQSVAQHVVLLELPKLPDKGDVSDWLAAGGGKVQLLELVERASSVTDTAPSSNHGTQNGTTTKVNAPGELLVESLAGLRPKPLRWLSATGSRSA